MEDGKKRKTEIINLLDTVFIPDFTFRHQDGRRKLMEIVGFCRPDYLRRKLDKSLRAQRDDLLIAVNADLNVSEGSSGTSPATPCSSKERLTRKR